MNLGPVRPAARAGPCAGLCEEIFDARGAIAMSVLTSQICADIELGPRALGVAVQPRQAVTASDEPGPHDPIVLPARTGSKAWSDPCSAAWPASNSYPDSLQSSIQVQIQASFP